MESRRYSQVNSPASEGVHPPSSHPLRVVERSTGRSVGGRMSEPGDRAPKRISSPGAQAVNVAEGESVSPKNGRGEDAPPGVQGVRRAQKSLHRKLGDLAVASPPVVGGRQSRESDKRHAVTASCEKSDEAVVPEKSAKMRVTPFESMEERAEAKGSSAARNARSTQSELRAPTQTQRIRQGATRTPVLRSMRPSRCHHRAAPDWTDAAVRAAADSCPSPYASNPRWEPGAGNPPAGLCPGGGPKGPSLPERPAEPRDTMMWSGRQQRGAESKELDLCG